MVRSEAGARLHETREWRATPGNGTAASNGALRRAAARDSFGIPKVGGPVAKRSRNRGAFGPDFSVSLKEDSDGVRFPGNARLSRTSVAQHWCRGAHSAGYLVTGPKPSRQRRRRRCRSATPTDGGNIPRYARAAPYRRRQPPVATGAPPPSTSRLRLPALRPRRRFPRWSCGQSMPANQPAARLTSQVRRIVIRADD